MSIFTDLAESVNNDSAPEEKQSASPVQSFETLRESYSAALRDKAVAMQNDGNFDLNEADVRFSTSLNLNRVRSALVAIVGAGGLGNWQWRILAAMGFKRIAIYDDDEVGIENVGPQAHSVFDLGLPKVKAIENAALAYRGIKIIGRKKRVFSYYEICADLGEDPDIVIGCTDSADFRNGFIEYLCNSILRYDREERLPDLFIDYRMSLGDWAGYIVPAKALRQHGYKPEFCGWYKRVAVFSESEAVQEPCTERAIAYTGANVASFTGALLHWFYSGGRQKFYDNDFMEKFVKGKTVMPGRKTSFSSKDFEFITSTTIERKLSAKIERMKAQENKPWSLVRQGYGLPVIFDYYDSGEGLPEDYTEKYHGKVIIGLKSHKAWLCGFDCLFNFQSKVYGLDLTFFDGCEKELNLVQPYVVFNAHTLTPRLNRAFLLLSEPVGTMFRIGNTTTYVRTQKAYLERMTFVTRNMPQYEIVKWSDFSDEEHLPVITDEAAIKEEFDKFASIKNLMDTRTDSQHEKEEQRELTRDELEVGMIVCIQDEIVQIDALEASHFRVRSLNGETANYSWRRMPAIYAVNDEDAETEENQSENAAENTCLVE